MLPGALVRPSLRVAAGAPSRAPIAAAATAALLRISSEVFQPGSCERRLLTDVHVAPRPPAPAAAPPAGSGCCSLPRCSSQDQKGAFSGRDAREEHLAHGGERGSVPRLAVRRSGQEASREQSVVGDDVRRHSFGRHSLQQAKGGAEVGLRHVVGA
eukprot:scaffold4944_cov135-Isochrysis_galbana.AAC.5